MKLFALLSSIVVGFFALRFAIGELRAFIVSIVVLFSIVSYLMMRLEEVRGEIEEQDQTEETPPHA